MKNDKTQKSFGGNAVDNTTTKIGYSSDHKPPLYVH